MATYGITSEVYAEHTSGELNGYTTYRLFATSTNSNDTLGGISSSNTDGNVTSFSTDDPDGFYKNQYHNSEIIPDINPQFFSVLPELEYTTFLTIGGADSTTISNLSTINVSTLSDGDNSYDLELNGINSGSIYYPHTYVKEFTDNKVLIAQLTLKTEANFTFNAALQIYENGLLNNNRIEQLSYSSATQEEESNTSNVTGDPHITTMNGKVYEIPDKVASYRMVEGSKFRVNTSTRYFTQYEKDAIHRYYLNKTGDMYNLYNLVTDGVVQNEALIQNEDQIISYNFDTKQLQSNQDVSYTVENGTITLKLHNNTHGKINLRLSHYENPQIFSGVSCSVENKNNMHGLLVDMYNTQDYEINSVADISQKEEGTLVNVSQRTIVKKL